MPFPGGRYRSTAPATARGRSPSSVFAVGRRVFVACAAAQLAGVTLTDGSGATACGRLRDGAEVEIVAWRPLGSGGTRYLVRSRDGLEGWLGVADLRSSNAVRPAVTPSGKVAGR